MLSYRVFTSLIASFFILTVSGQTIDNKFSLTVSQDGSGDYSTIQEAINQVRDHAEKQVVIHIKPGVYKEKLVIPTYKRNVKLKGSGQENTIIEYNDYSGKPREHKDETGNPNYSTYTSYTLLIAANDCTLEDLTIANSAGPVGQAVALHIESDRVQVKNCIINGHQDTLYIAKGGTRSFFENCQIIGTTDFIFGAATAYFNACTITSLRNSYITAASTTKEDPYGFVFESCKLESIDNSVDKVFLGRPWRPYAKTVFLNTEMGSHIVPEGWHHWPGDKNFPDKEKTAFYAEYRSFGPGAKELKNRVSWSKQLTSKQASNFSKKKVLRGWLD